MQSTWSRIPRPTPLTGSRRRGGRRAVSDIVAVILVVAITVVLAAVLYYLVSSITHTVGTAPLGTEFAWGSPANDTSTGANGCGSSGHYCYHIDIEVTGSSVNLDQFTLALQALSGVPVGWPTSVTAAGGTIGVIGPNIESTVALYWPLNSTWQLVSPFKGVLGAGYSLVIYCGGAAETSNQGLWGLELVAVGTNGYSGTVSSPVFP